MRMLALSSRWIRYLRSQPESGMGYQVVDIVLANSEILESLIVVNGELVELPNDHLDVENEDIERVRIHVG